MGDTIVGEGKIKLICDLTGLTAGLKDSEKQTAESIGKMSATVTRGMTIAAVAALACGVALKVLVDRAVDTGEKFAHLSAEIGMTTEELSRLAYAALTADVTAEQMSQAVGFLSKQIVATAGSAFLGETALGRMGISVKTAAGEMRTTHEVLLDVANVFQRLPDGPQKTALALELFGRSGKNMIPLLNEGAGAITELERRADELGITVSEKFAHNAHEFHSQMELMKARIHNVGRSLAEDMLPALNNVMHLLAGDFAPSVGRVNDGMTFMSSIMRALSPDFDDFATKMEKIGKQTSYSEFLFKRWAADIDAAIIGLRMVGPTVTAILGSPFMLLDSSDPNQKGPLKQQLSADATAGAWKRGWDNLKDWWRGWWTDMQRIFDEGAAALEDLQRRYFVQANDEDVLNQIARLKIQEENEAKLNHQLQLDIIRKRGELAQLNLQGVQQMVDFKMPGSAEGEAKIESARAQVRLFADAIAVVAREEAKAQGANEALANAMYVYTKRTLEAQFANEDMARSIAKTRKELELELQNLRSDHDAKMAVLKNTLDGYRLEAAQLEEKTRFEEEEADKTIKNEEQKQTRLTQIRRAAAIEREGIGKREARAVEDMNRESMMNIVSITQRGYTLELAQIEERRRRAAQDAERTIADEKHLAARRIAIDEEYTAAKQDLDERYSKNFEVVLARLVRDEQMTGIQLLDVMRDIFTQMKSTVSQVFFDVVTLKLHDLDDDFKNLAKSILRHFTDMLADQVIKQLEAWLLHLIRQILAARAAAQTNAIIEMASMLTFATGGLLTGGFLPLRRFASGGVATGPMLGLVGEAGQNEAIVPLPDGRAIPVRMTENARPININLALTWTSDLISMFKTTDDEISLAINRQLMQNGPLRKQIRTRG